MSKSNKGWVQTYLPLIISIISLIISVNAHRLAWYVPPRAEISIIEETFICQNLTDSIYLEINGIFVNEGERDTRIDQIEIKYTFYSPYGNLVKLTDVEIYQLEKTHLSEKESSPFDIIDILHYNDYEYKIDPNSLGSIEITIIHDDGKGVIKNIKTYSPITFNQ